MNELDKSLNKLQELQHAEERSPKGETRAQCAELFKLFLAVCPEARPGFDEESSDKTAILHSHQDVLEGNFLDGIKSEVEADDEKEFVLSIRGYIDSFMLEDKEATCHVLPWPVVKLAK
jgi:hypothetical protein